MNALPSELIHELCLILKDDDPQTLYPISLVSSRFYNIAAPFLYDTVTIKFTGLSDLESITAEHAESGLGRTFLSHATRLDIIALPERIRRTRQGETGGGRHAFGSPDKAITIQDFIPITVGSFMERLMPCFDLPGYGLRWSDDPGYYSAKEWLPLVSLLSRLKKLKSLHYAVANSFPRSLLDAVHQYHPSCEINIWSLQSVSLDLPGAGQICASNHYREVDAATNDLFDMQVLQSPCLRAIKLDYPILWDAPQPFYPHLIIPYVSQAPNMKHIYLRLDSKWREGFWNAIQSHSESTISSLPLVNLHSFSLQTWVFEEQILSKWNQIIGFSALRSLRLPQIECPSLLKDAAPGLVSLERFSICVVSRRTSGWDLISEELLCIFQRLRPLKYLCIEALEEISFLHTILERHGPSLVGLMLEPFERYSLDVETEYAGFLYPFLDHVHLQRIAERCPNMRHLRLPIRRSKGDHVEVRTYRALGNFLKLQNLILDLYGNPRPVLSREDGLYQNDDLSDYSCAHVSRGDAFINFAIDSTLATAIWREIFSHQESRRLIRLRVSPWGYDIFDRPEIYIFLEMARSFFVTHGGTKVVEIGREEREAEQEVIAEDDEYDDETPPFQISASLCRSLDYIWPPTSGYSEWTDNWSSFPLQTDV